jgi:hypothetical protein
MAFSVFPAPAAGKTRFATTLTSGTSYTVPAGVTYLNVTLVGGGGGSGGGNSTSFGGASSGGTGGTTTFTGATSATGGAGGAGINNTNGLMTSAITELNAYSPTANTGLGAFGTRQNSRYNQDFWPSEGHNGSSGQRIKSTLSATAGASIVYAIGAGGTAGSGGTAGTGGAAGGSGFINIEYWV